ncbi:MAG: hypothetical protein RBU25_17310 [Lentisphaeria bacterium]|jgi:hypothetical protein|nr:hypothetical protein [Lentisphaeria bacterium]
MWSEFWQEALEKDGVGMPLYPALQELAGAVQERIYCCLYKNNGTVHGANLFKGDWDAGIRYQVGDVVRREGPDKGPWQPGQTYNNYDQVSHEPDRGEWNETTGYFKYDRVSVTDPETGIVARFKCRNGSVYSPNINRPPAENPVWWWPIAQAPGPVLVCRSTHTDIHPSNGSYWVIWPLATRTFRATDRAVRYDDNLGKDPLTQSAYWSADAGAVLHPGWQLGISWFNNLESAINQLYLSFANHTEADTWVGSEDIDNAIRPWSEIDLLLHLGYISQAEYENIWSSTTAYQVGDRVVYGSAPYQRAWECRIAHSGSAPNSSNPRWLPLNLEARRIFNPGATSSLQQILGNAPPLGQWMIQKYRMLNMFRWVRWLRSGMFTRVGFTRSATFGGTDRPWSELVASFKAKPWASSSGTDYPSAAYSAAYDATYRRYFINGGSFTRIDVTFPRQCAVDVYCFGEFSGGYSTFQPMNGVDVPGRLYLVRTTDPASSHSIHAATPEEYDAMSYDTPGVNGIGVALYTQGRYINQSNIIYRFDVEGGFNFCDGIG